MENLQTNLWNNIKDFYKEKFDMEPEVVDIIPDFYILKLCATGASSVSIARYLDYDLDVVGETLDVHFGFQGWVFDLPYNPLRLYKNMDDKSLEHFKETVITCYGYIDADQIERMYRIVTIVYEMEKLLNEKWI